MILRSILEIILGIVLNVVKCYKNYIDNKDIYYRYTKDCVGGYRFLC